MKSQDKAEENERKTIPPNHVLVKYYGLGEEIRRVARCGVHVVCSPLDANAVLDLLRRACRVILVLSGGQDNITSHLRFRGFRDREIQER